MSFDPDQFLAERRDQQAFDPDQFLAQRNSDLTIGETVRAAGRGIAEAAGSAIDAAGRIFNPPALQDAQQANLDAAGALIDRAPAASDMLWAASDLVVPPALRAGYTAAGAVTGLAAGPGAPAAVPVGAAAGYGLGDNLAQQYEVARGLRPAYDIKQQLKGMATTGVGMAAPGASPAATALGTVLKSGAKTGAIFATAEGAGQLATGERDLGHLGTSTAFGVAFGMIGAAVHNALITSAERARMMDYAREFGFEGKSWSDLRNWWQTKRADLARPVEPVAAAPAEPAPTAPRQLPAVAEASKPAAPAPAVETAAAPKPLPKVDGATITKPIAPIAASVPPPPVKVEPTAAKVLETAQASTPKELKVQKQYLVNALSQLAQEAPATIVRTPAAQAEIDALKARLGNSEHVSAELAAEYGLIQDTSTQSKKRSSRIQLSDLERMIDLRHEQAITIQVPGDGTFRVRNERGAIEALRDRVKKEFGSGLAAKQISSPGTGSKVAPRVTKKPSEADVHDALKLAASADQQRPILNHVVNDRNLSIATDGRRIVVRRGKYGARLDEGMQFKVGKETMQYPNYLQVIPASVVKVEPKTGSIKWQEKPNVIADPVEGLKILARIKPLISERDRTLKLHDVSGRLGFSYAYNNDAFVSEGVRSEMPAVRGVNPDFMEDLFKQALKLGLKEVPIHISQDSRAPIVAMLGKDAISVIMPHRLEDGSAAPNMETGDPPSAPRHKRSDYVKPAKRVRGGSSAAGDPMPAAGMPPIPPGVPSASLNDARMPVAMEPIVKGTVDTPTVLAALEDVATAVGMHTAFRSGRFYAQARGIAKEWAEVIRLQSINNLPTAAHEIAHIISKRLFGGMKSRELRAAIGQPAVVNELVALGKALYGSTKPYAGYTAEGFSELVRLWLSTDDAAKAAPEAVKWFEGTLLPTQPKLHAALTKARQLYDLWRGQGAKRRIEAQTKAEPGRLQRLAQWAKQNLSSRAVVEEFTPLEQLAQAYTATTGQHLRADKNPYLIATALRSVAGARLETWVNLGMTDLAGNLTGPSLREAVAPVKSYQAGDFETYLTALEAIERHRQGKNPGLELIDAIYVRDKLQAEHPEFARSAEAVADWWDGVLAYKRAAYPEMNGPVIDRVRRRNPRYYGPLARVLDPIEAKRRESETAGGGLQHFKGSGRPIKRLVLQSLRTAEGIIASAHRDAILRSIVQLSKTEGMGWVVEEVPRSRVMEQVSLAKIASQLEAMGIDTSELDPDTIINFANQASTPTGVDPIIAVREGNATRWYQVPPQVFEILAGVQESARLGPLFELFMGMPNRAFKLGTTGVRASFSLVTNPLRDLPTYMLQSITGNPASRAAAYLQAMGDIVRAGLGGKESEALHLVDRLGLQSSTFIGGDIEQTRREARALFHDGKWFRRLRSPVETLREILSFTETGPRAAEMASILRETGWKPGQPLTMEQAVMAMVAFKRVTTDFSAKGSGWRPLYRSVPYMGAATQGLRSFARSFKQDQGTKQRHRAALKVILNGLTMLTLPALWNWWANKDEEWYRNLPWRERYLYLNVAAGAQVYQIPLAPDWASAFVTTPVALLDSWYLQDPASAREALKHIFSVTQPLDYPVLLGAAKEQWQNRIDFFDRPIIPRGELDLLPGQQRSEYTSQLAKELGDLFPGNISPRRVDAALRQVFGGVGGDLATAPDTFMRLLDLKTQEPTRDWEPADVPVLGRLARRGGKYSALSQPLLDYWDDYQRYSRWEQTNAKDIREGHAPSYPMTVQQRAYSIRLQAMRPFVQLRLEVAARTPEQSKRQELYRLTARRVREILATRPKD